MTFHRWRKAHANRAALLVAKLQESEPEWAREQREHIVALQLENLRLRRLVTDLLLEKLKLQEEGASPSKKAGLSLT